MMADFSSVVAELRHKQYRLSEKSEHVQSVWEAIQFVNRVGFCLLSQQEGIVLPNLSDVSQASPRRWKDEIVMQRLAYYGRPFHGRPGFVSLDLLPSLYALTPTAGCGGDRFELYKRRYLSADANRIASIVLAKGPLSTRALRREVGMAGRQHRHRFLRALFEAEARFLIVNSGITKAEASHYSYLWEPFHTLFRQAIAESEGITVEAAAARIITTYLKTSVAATIPQIAAIFTLNEAFVRQMADQWEQDRLLSRHQDAGQEYLVEAEAAALL